MGQLFYQLFLWIYSKAIRLASLFNPKAKAFLKGRADIWPQAEMVNPDAQPLIWVHCASLGEFEQARPILEKCRTAFPDHKLLVTFFSPSGYEIRKNYSGADHILYLPPDGKKNAEKWISRVKPSIALFIKYEFWYFYLSALNENGIPAISVSSIFREDQIFFQPWGNFQRKTLNLVEHFFVQDENSKELLDSINMGNVTVTGDTRFDRVMEIRKNADDLPEITAFIGDRKAFIAGSAWAEDMDVLVPFINEQDLVFLIAPHELDKRFMDQIEADLEKRCVRYSRWLKDPSGNYDVMIVDTIGMLSKLYAYGKYAWVGGAYGQGLHNILEAAVYGIPVFFGNRNYKKFREARDLINLGGAYAVANYMELREKFTLLELGENYDMAKEINTEYIKSQLGATQLIMEYLTKKLKV